MANTTIMPSLAEPEPDRPGSRPRVLWRRLVEDGIADTRALGRSLASIWRLLLRRQHRRSGARDLDQLHEEIGLAALTMPEGPASPTRAAALDQQARTLAARSELTVAKTRHAEAAAALADRRNEARSVLDFLSEEGRHRKAALAALEEKAQKGLPLADSDGPQLSIEDLRQAALEAEEVRRLKEAEWQQAAVGLQGAVTEAEADLKRATRDLTAADEALRLRCRELGAERQGAADSSPELTPLLARAASLGRDLSQDDIAVEHLTATLRADRLPALRALLVLALALALVLTLTTLGIEAASSTSKTKPPGDFDQAPVSAAATTLDVSSSADRSADPLDASLRSYLLALPELAPRQDARAEWRATSDFSLESTRAAAGACRWLNIRAGLECRDLSQESWQPRSLYLALLIDAEGQILEHRVVAASGPEDDELFRLLEERP